MRSSIAAVALALAGPAFGLEMTLTNDQFTVTTSSGFEHAIVGGAVELQDPPYFLAYASPGGSPSSGEFILDYVFAPKAGYALRGETVSFSMDMRVDEASERTTLLSAALAQFSVGVDALHSVTRSSEGGVTHYAASWFVTDPHVLVDMAGIANEGRACVKGYEADDCDFGGGIIDLDAYVQLGSLSVTPLLSAVPEPDTAASSMAALGAFALAGLLTRRSARRPHRH
jgi:hypothetical protein